MRGNESQDDHDLYSRTNAAARELDPTRQTSGVRYLKQSELLEDVYAYNDFSYDGEGAGCEDKDKVTSDKDKAYLVSEYNGHMFPTKMFDSEAHRREHLLRHAQVLNDIAEEPDIAGSFGWCFADYNTHRDFGSGDRICYHGVTDMFRNPKPAAAVYAAQQENTPVLFVTSSMDIGEQPGGSPGRVYIVSNADSVAMYRNGELLHTYTQKDSAYQALRHGPVLISDYIGKRLAEGEDFTPRQAKLAAELLNHSAVSGASDLPPAMLKNGAELMLRWHMDYADAYRLYGKYIGGWGDSTTVYRFTAVRDGKVIAELIKEPVTGIRLELKVSHTDLSEGDCYDMAAIRARMLDQNGNQLYFYNDSADLSCEGPIEIVGPRAMQLRGGSGGTYIRTTGEAGEAKLFIESTAGTQQIDFTVTKGKADEQHD